MPDPTATDDDLIDQLRAWGDDLADQIPPVASPATTTARRRPTRVLALAAAVLALLAVAAAVVTATADDTDGEDVRAGTTTGPTTTATTDPDLPLLETTWWLERVEVDGEASVVTPDRSLTLLLTEDRICAGSDDCPDPDAFMVGADGCNGYTATVELADDRLTALSWGGHTLMACPPRPGDEISSLANGTSTFAIEGDTLVLRLADRTTFTFRAETDPAAPVPEGHSVLVEGDGQVRHRWSWNAFSGRAAAVIAGYATANGGNDVARAEYVPRAGGTRIAVGVAQHDAVLVGLVDARATVVTYERADVVVEMPTRALEGQPELRAFSGSLEEGATGWRLTATAADGTTVATYAPPP